MISDRKQKLEKTMAALEDRWGSSAVQPLRQRLRSPVPHIPTGFPALDEATGIGGLPTGRITEIVGSPTSGTVTLALTLAARTQKKIGSIVYIDLGHNFDPTFAARCGLDMEQLILVRPKDTEHALSILLDFISDGTVGALVFDADPFLLSDYQSMKALAATLGRIISPLSQSSCMLLFVTSQQKAEQQTNASYGDRNTNGSLIPHHSAIRLQIQHEKWLYKDGDIAGYKAQISVVKNKLGAAGKQANMSIWLYGNRSFEIATAAGAKPEGGAS